ncbi:hypothetical protein ACNI3T_13780 [Christiangramia sp. ASW11-125]|uniref:hypothetical protein n=1 Tax=Christiangramia sp. ASW11-125 TaxID=3400701 RepID=UPI003AAEB871
MSENRTKIEALLELSDMSVSNHKKVLIELNELLGNCIQDLFDLKIKFEDAGLFEKLLFQIIYHNSSIIKLDKGSVIKVRDKEFQVNDMTSIYSLMRLQIETFINLSYLFFIDCNYPTKLRVCVYKIQGLRKQIELTKKHSKEFAPIAKLRNELSKELWKLRKIDEFKELPFNERRKFIDPKHARLLKPEEVYSLINIGNLSESHGLYSNHIHSEYISIRQLVSSLNDPIAGRSHNSIVFMLCSRITSVTITNLNRNYKIQEGTLSKTSPRLKSIIESFNIISGNL